ncbi:MAG TPA: type I restriction enzyme endonuclease domain-containing protein [Thermomicrobiales bacterium]|jgi:type I restriction enzyme R subunit
MDILLRLFAKSLTTSLFSVVFPQAPAGLQNCESPKFDRARVDACVRANTNRLTEEELAVLDLLTKPGPRLRAKKEQVRTAARDLLAALKRGKLVLDWRKKQTAKAQVQVTIQRMLAEGLPRAYSLVEMREKSEVVYQHVYDAYAGEGQSLYSWQDAFVGE